MHPSFFQILEMSRKGGSGWGWGAAGYNRGRLGRPQKALHK